MRGTVKEETISVFGREISVTGYLGYYKNGDYTWVSPKIFEVGMKRGDSQKILAEAQEVYEQTKEQLKGDVPEGHRRGIENTQKVMKEIVDALGGK